MLDVKETQQIPECSISEENRYICNVMKRVVQQMKCLLWRDSCQFSANRTHCKRPLQHGGSKTPSTVLAVNGN